MAKFDRDLAWRGYRALVRIREVELAIAARYPDQEMRCPVHLSVGQEGVAVGACLPLSADDLVLAGHRSHAQYLAKGGDLTAMLAEIHGRETGCCGGRGGSMHLLDVEAGLLASIPIVGSHLPLAVGVALARRQRREPGVAVAFLGDGAVETGAFHETLNFAALHRLPVVFVLEDNGYSVYTPLAERQPPRPLTDVGLSHGVEGQSVSGDDFLEVHAAMETALVAARSGAGPQLLVASTSRWLEHCGPYDDDHLGYRPQGELERAKQRCPIRRLGDQLRKSGELDDRREKALYADVRSEIDAAFAAAFAAPQPSAATAAEHVYG
ncbi:MAG: thiamine pyrophosphate-dependent dehydrogenase E1 component subunit alpha [Thermoanaerobaculia bacterium]|nr:thiamine pyrophosphate-dependent dehydrogenase E1 component subunit alpha [Thermoanaerobaculia bacterium]